MKILSLDPGLSTGWAMFDLRIADPLELIRQGVIDAGVEGFIDWVWGDFLNQVDHVVCERFVIDGTITGTWSSQIEGALQAVYRPSEITWQLRSDKATLFNQKWSGDKGQTERFNWLRERGFSGEDHELDAITHALVWAKRQEHMPTLRKYWG